MRILYLVHQYMPEHTAGTEVYTHALAKRVAADHEVTVVCHEQSLDGGAISRQESIYDGVRVIRLAGYVGDRRDGPLRLYMRSYRNRALERQLAEILDAIEPDLVHIQHLKDLSVGATRLAASRNIPVMMTLHDYWALCPNAQCVRPDGRICETSHARLDCGVCAAERIGSPALARLAPLMAPLFWHRQRAVLHGLALVDRFIAPSRFLASKYEAAGLAHGRIQVIENGLDRTRLESLSDRDTRAYRGHYAFLGSLAWQKGAHVLIEAAKLIQDLDVTIRLYGDPAAFPSYSSALAIAADKLPNVSLEGAVPFDRIGQVYAWADALVVPSLWWENSPVTIQEARAARIPVIASRLGALPEKVVDGASGLLFEPGNAADLARAIRRMHGDPALRERLAADIPDPISIDDHVAEVMGIYRELTDGR